VAYATLWEVVPVKACTSLYLHTFNCVILLFISLAAVRWYCNLRLALVKEAFGIVDEFRILSVVSLLCGVVHIMLETYLRLLATDGMQIAVTMACMFLNLNGWMLVSSIFSLGWPLLQLQSIDREITYKVGDQEPFKAVLTDKESRQRFFGFVEQLFCRELVMLWNDIHVFRSLQKDDRTQHEAWVIYNKYLEPDAILKVGVAAEFFYEISAQLDKAEHPRADLFDTVQEMVNIKLQRAFKRYQFQNMKDFSEKDFNEISAPEGLQHEAVGCGYLVQTDTNAEFDEDVMI